MSHRVRAAHLCVVQHNTCIEHTDLSHRLCLVGKGTTITTRDEDERVREIERGCADRLDIYDVHVYGLSSAHGRTQHEPVQLRARDSTVQHTAHSTA